MLLLVIAFIKLLLDLMPYEFGVCWFDIYAATFSLHFIYLHRVYEFWFWSFWFSAHFGVVGLFFSVFILVEASDANERESIAYQLSFDLFIKHTWAAERWQAVHLEDPRSQLVVENDIETINLEAALLSVSQLIHVFDDLFFCTQKGLYDYIVASCKRINCMLEVWIVLYLSLLQILSQEC